MTDDRETGAAVGAGAPAREAFRDPGRLTLAALVLGLSVELLFDGRQLGISFLIWAAMCLIAGFGLAALEGRRPAPGSVWLSVPILLLSAAASLRLEGLTLFLNLVLTLGLMALWVRTFRSGRLLDFGWIDFGVALAWVPLEAWGRPWGVLAAATRRWLGDRGANSRLLAVVRGLLLALPVLVVFAALLTAADLVFADYVRNALSWLNLDRLADYARRAVIVVAAALFLLGALVTALRDPERRTLIGETKPLMSPFLGALEAGIVLATVDLLFAAFVLVQARYLFGGQANISAAGYTFSEYARRGFGELVAVSVLTLGLIYALAAWTRRDRGRERAWLNALSALMVGLVAVILASAYMRLRLYEDAYGFTRLRTYTHAAILWMGVLFVAFLALLLVGRLRRFAPAAALAAIGFALTLNVMNVDGFIVRQNAARLAATGKIDLDYLASLSDDAVPEIARLAQASPDPLRGRLLAHLACRRAALQQEARQAGWPSYHFARDAAGRALAPLQASLDGYKVEAAGPIRLWSVLVDGEARPCFTPTVD